MSRPNDWSYGQLHVLWFVTTATSYSSIKVGLYGKEGVEKKASNYVEN